MNQNHSITVPSTPLGWSASVFQSLRARVQATPGWLPPVAVMMWFSFLCFPQFLPNTELDSSWQQALGYFVKCHRQAGSDYLWTYGPLGFFTTGLYDPDLFWPYYLWEVVLKAIVVLTLLRISRYLPNQFTRLAFLVTSILFLSPAYYISDAFYRAFLLTLGIALLKDQKGSTPYLAFNSFLIAGISLIKFSFFPLCLVMVLGLEYLHRVRHRQVFLSPLPLFSVSWLLIWVILRQGLKNIPAFFIGSFQIALGYNEAMASTEPVSRTVISLALGAIVIFSATVLLLGMREGRSVEAIAGAIFFELCLYLSWKYGFTRSDPGHYVQFFLHAAFLTWLLLIYFNRGVGWVAFRVVLVSAGLLVNLWGLLQEMSPEQIRDGWLERYENSLIVLPAPLKSAQALEPQRAEEAKKGALPQIRARVGDAPVDMFSFSQAVVFFNRLNYQPRPVIQGYSAYTPYLISTNARFYRQDRAPEFIIFQFGTIDDRLPTLDDGQAFLEILKHYQPVLKEQSYLLLRRAAAPGGEESVSSNSVAERRIRFGEEVLMDNFPGAHQLVSLKFKASWKGKLAKFLYRPSEVTIEVRTAAHGTLTYRLIPSMTETGFLLNPLVQDSDDVLGLYQGAEGKRVISFTVSAKSPAAFQEDIAMTVTACPQLVGGRPDQTFPKRSRYPMMKTPPDRAQPANHASPTLCEGKEVLLLSAPGELGFTLPSGARRVVGKFGILPVAYEHTDGSQFALEYRPAGGGTQMLFERTLDPRKNPQDRGSQEVGMALPPGAQGELVFRTSIIPGRNADWNFPYWSDIEIQNGETSAR